MVTVAGPVPGPDTSSLRAELMAIGEVADAAQEIDWTYRWRLWIDNRTAIAVFTDTATTRLYWGIATATRRRWASKIACLRWVPAHDRHLEWCPQDENPVEAPRLRCLNRKADEACTAELCEQQRQDKQMVGWHDERQCASQWTATVLAAALDRQNWFRKNYET